MGEKINTDEIGKRFRESREKILETMRKQENSSKRLYTTNTKVDKLIYSYEFGNRENTLVGSRVEMFEPSNQEAQAVDSEAYNSDEHVSENAKTPFCDKRALYLKRQLLKEIGEDDSLHTSEEQEIGCSYNPENNKEAEDILQDETNDAAAREAALAEKSCRGIVGSIEMAENEEVVDKDDGYDLREDKPDENTTACMSDYKVDALHLHREHGNNNQSTFDNECKSLHDQTGQNKVDLNSNFEENLDNSVDECHQTFDLGIVYGNKAEECLSHDIADTMDFSKSNKDNLYIEEEKSSKVKEDDNIIGIGKTDDKTIEEQHGPEVYLDKNNDENNNNDSSDSKPALFRSTSSLNTEEEENISWFSFIIGVLTCGLC